MPAAHTNVERVHHFLPSCTRCSHRAITTLINNRITRFTENGLLRNKMRVYTIRVTKLRGGASSELLCTLGAFF